MKDNNTLSQKLFKGNNQDFGQYLNSPRFEQDFRETMREKSECPIGLDSIHCPSCVFNPSRAKCEYYEFRGKRVK